MNLPFSFAELSRSFLKNDTLSIDIGFTNIKIVHSRKKNTDTLRIMNYGITPTPPNCIKNGVISDMEGIAVNLKKVITSNGINERNVKIVISAGSNIVSKVLYIKKNETKKIEELIIEEIPRYIPANMRSYKLFYRITGNAEISGIEHYKVLITVVPNTVIDNYVKLVRYLDFKPLAVEIPFSSVARFFGRGVNIDKEVYNTSFKLMEDGDRPVTVVDLGSETTNISILRDGALEFNRIILVGGRVLDDEIAKRLEISRETAERYKKMLKINDISEAKDENDTTIWNCINEYLKEVLMNIKRSMDFYVSRCSGDNPGKVVFVGGGSGLAGLKPLAEKIIGIPAYTVDMMNFTKIEMENNLDRDKLKYLVNAIGIAM